MNRGYNENRCITSMIWECNVLLKYLFNQCSKAEKLEVDSWLNESPQNQLTLKYLRVQLLSNH